jgi:hypothetical protein
LNFSSNRAIRLELLEEGFVADARLASTIDDRRQILFVFAQRLADRVGDDVGNGATGARRLHPQRLVQGAVQVDRGTRDGWIHGVAML